VSNLEKGVNIFLGGLIVVAFASVLVAPKSQTPAVLGAAGGALSGSLKSAEGNS
jgi:hypothetical protein